MFTGIISDIGTVIAVDKNSAHRVRIACTYAPNSFKRGESVACNGVCLTVVAYDTHNTGAYFDVELSPETLALTASRWNINDRINLERALKAGDDISGHFVTGHVDGLATLTAIQSHNGSYQLRLAAPPALAHFLAPKGSVTLDGVSLTVNEVQNTEFSVTIIPHTWMHTRFPLCKTNDALNMEVDMIARYISRLLEAQTV